MCTYLYSFNIFPLWIQSLCIHRSYIKLHVCWYDNILLRTVPYWWASPVPGWGRNAKAATVVFSTPSHSDGTHTDAVLTQLPLISTQLHFRENGFVYPLWASSTMRTRTTKTWLKFVSWTVARSGSLYTVTCFSHNVGVTHRVVIILTASSTHVVTSSANRNVSWNGRPRRE